MFLRMNTLLMLALLSFGLSAQASKISQLSAGNYTLISGDSDLCPPFKISTKDIGSKDIYIGQNQLFITENSVTTSQSDLDSRCEFKDQSIRTETGSETVLKMINQEICSGKIRSSITSSATIRTKEIELIFQVPGAQTEICKYKTR